MKFPLLLTAVAAALFVAGCAQEEHQAQYAPVYSSDHMRGYKEPVSVPTPRTVTVSRQVIYPSNGSIVAAVRESLRRNIEIAPMVPNIEINANNGAVVLSGWVQSVEQKRQVGAITRDVSGVVAVNNQLVPLVDPTAPKPVVENQSPSPLLNGSSANQANNTNGLTPTAHPDGSEKLYQQSNPPQGGENTNGNQMP